jgi:hypothetical protein
VRPKLVRVLLKDGGTITKTVHGINLDPNYGLTLITTGPPGCWDWHRIPADLIRACWVGRL